MTPRNLLRLTLQLADDHESVPLEFPVRRLVNAGYVGRDQAAVRAHIDELRHEGIPAPANVPALFTLTADAVTTEGEIEVIGRETSGEVEYVLLQTEDDLFVGVGSDHTDRALERASMGKSKQVCKNVVSTRVWRYRDLREYWDDLLLRSWVLAPETGQEILYQEGRLGTILSAEELMALVRSRMKDKRRDGLMIFSGTVPIVTGRIVYSGWFRGELLDPHRERALRCTYRTLPLEYLDGAEA